MKSAIEDQEGSVREAKAVGSKERVGKRGPKNGLAQEKRNIKR